jgi:flagellar protein FlbD
MIKVTRLNGEEFYINPDLMEFVEETPDTVISMTTGRKVIVRETVEEVLDHILEYRRMIFFFREDKTPE